MQYAVASRTIPRMGLVGWIRFALAERKIRCKNCATVSADLVRGFCSDECRVDYNTITDEEWQAHG